MELKEKTHSTGNLGRKRGLKGILQGEVKAKGHLRENLGLNEA